MSFQVFGCPSCQQPFQVASQQAGQVVQCPSCTQTIEIPANSFEKSPPREPDPVVFACPSCQGQFGVTVDMYGQHVGCPHCQTNVLVAPSGGEQLVSEPESFVPQIDTSTTRSKKRTKAKKNKPGPIDLEIERDLFAPSPKGETASKNPQIPAPPATPPSPKRPTSPAAAPQNKRTKPPTKTHSGKSNTPPTQNQPVEQVKAGKQTPTRQSAPPPSTGNQIKLTTESEKARNIDHLLPPRFDVLDPNRLSVGSGNRDFKILLPDGDGGAKQFDQRVMRVEHDGEQVALVSMTPEQRRRRRLIQNIIAIAIGIIIMAIAFTFLR